MSKKYKYQIRGYDHIAKKTYLIVEYKSGGRAIGYISKSSYLHMGNFYKKEVK